MFLCLLVVATGFFMTNIKGNPDGILFMILGAIGFLAVATWKTAKA